MALIRAVVSALLIILAMWLFGHPFTIREFLAWECVGLAILVEWKGDE